MKSNKNLVLLGMMGSGKSTIGYLLSKNLNIEFMDVDKIIEKEEKCKISEIFEKKGEIEFRKIEEKITLKLLKSNKKIISLGGGGFINDKIRNEVLLNHISFWLNWDNTTLINRIKSSKKRPIVINASQNEIKKLISDRSKIYSMANYKINCEKF
jgi:shikimate kinase